MFEASPHVTSGNGFQKGNRPGGRKGGGERLEGEGGFVGSV